MDAIMRMKFWIAVGLLVLISGVVLGVLFVPASAQNSRDMDSWKGTAESVESFKVKKDFRNQQAIDTAVERRSELEEAMRAVVQMHQERDQLLEQQFTDPDTGEPLEPGPWKVVYAEKMDELEEQVGKSFTLAAAGLVARRFYDTAWPEEEEMRRAEKNYWAQKYILEALAAVNNVRMVVPVFSHFSLLERPERLLHPSHGTMFTPTPFEMRIVTELRSLPLVLERLLRCKVALCVTTLQFERGAETALASAAAARRAGGIGAPARRTGPAVPLQRAAPTGYMQQWGADDAAAAEAAARAGAEAGARAQAEAAARDGAAAMGPPTGIPPTGVPVRPRSGPPGGARPVAGARRRTMPSAEERAEQAKVKPLVTVIIRGYILDYVPAEEGEQEGEEQEE